MRKGIINILITVFVFLVLTLQAQMPDRPVPPRLVNDFAQIFSSSEKNALEYKLVSYNDTTSTQITIVTVADLQGQDKSQYAIDLAHKWGVGQKGKDNGLIILIKPKQGNSKGQAFIAVGYGLEEYIPDATAKNIVEFDSVLKNTRSEATRRGYFRRLGAFLKHVSSLTGHFGKLDTAEYCDYLYPRLDELLSIDAETRSAIKKRVESILDSNKSKSVFNCLVSDFALGNLHIDENDQFVLVDLGDATFGNQYDNISYIYLNLKFGSLSLYFDLLNRSERYFLAFLEGYHLPDLDQEMLLLYKFKNLILMISFVESLKSGRKNILRNALSLLSNKYLIYRYKRRLLTELKM